MFYFVVSIHFLLISASSFAGRRAIRQRSNKSATILIALFCIYLVGFALDRLTIGTTFDFFHFDYMKLYLPSEAGTKANIPAIQFWFGFVFNATLLILLDRQQQDNCLPANRTMSRINHRLP